MAEQDTTSRDITTILDKYESCRGDNRIVLISQIEGQPLFQSKYESYKIIGKYRNEKKILRNIKIHCVIKYFSVEKLF